MEKLFAAPDYSSIKTDTSKYDTSNYARNFANAGGDFARHQEVLLNYVYTWRLHVKRSLSTNSIIHDVSSPQEMHFLRENCGIPDSMITARNFLVWRRSR
jgi:hypothetical protein